MHSRCTALTLHVFGGQETGVDNVLRQWDRVQREDVRDLERLQRLHVRRCCQVACKTRQLWWLLCVWMGVGQMCLPRKRPVSTSSMLTGPPSKSSRANVPASWGLLLLLRGGGTFVAAGSMFMCNCCTHKQTHTHSDRDRDRETQAVAD